MKYKIQLCKGRDYCVVDGIGRLVEMILDAQHRGFREPIISTIEPKDGIYTYQLTAGDTDRDRVQVPPDDPPEESWND